jgi:hypothetical protein
VLHNVTKHEIVTEIHKATIDRHCVVEIVNIVNILRHDFYWHFFLSDYDELVLIDEFGIGSQFVL